MTDWKIDLNRIKAKEKKTLQAAFAKMGEDGDTELFYPFAAKIIVSWPFEGEPSNIESYGELGLLDEQEVFNRINEEFQRNTPKPPNQVPESGVVSGEGVATGQTPSA